MALKLPPDVEKIVADYLQTQTDVAALIDDVFTDLSGIKPQDRPDRFILVTQLGGPVRYPRWIEEARLQIEAWYRGGTKPKARKIIHTVMAALPALENTVHTAEGVIGKVDVASAARWLPDPVPTPATPRWLLDATVTAHP